MYNTSLFNILFALNTFSSNLPSRHRKFLQVFFLPVRMTSQLQDIQYSYKCNTHSKQRRPTKYSVHVKFLTGSGEPSNVTFENSSDINFTSVKLRSHTNNVHDAGRKVSCLNYNNRHPRRFKLP